MIFACCLLGIDNENIHDGEKRRGGSGPIDHLE